MTHGDRAYRLVPDRVPADVRGSLPTILARLEHARDGILRHSASWSDRKVTVVVLAAVAVLGAASFAWIYGSHLTYFRDGPIRSDGTSYYVYLPAVFLDHDVTLEKTIGRDFAGDVSALQGVRVVAPYRRPLDPCGIGEAVMLSPFFAAGEGIAVVTGAKRNGFSWPYQVTAAAAGFAYALLGLALTASLLLRYFRRGTAVTALLAIIFGTNLFHYATYDAVLSHAFSLFLVAGVLRLSISVWERPRLSAVAVLGAGAGLVELVRSTNLVVLVFCALIGVESFADLRNRARVLLRRFDLVAVGAGIFTIVLLPQFAYWYEITGRIFVYAYPSDQRLRLLHPHLIGVLFSVRSGLYFWTPLLLLAVAGLSALRRSVPSLFVPAIAYLVVETWVVSSWSVWSYGGGFGMRPFVEAMPVFALGLAALIEAARRALPRRLLRVGIAATTLLSVHAMLAYWTMAIPFENATWHDYLSSFAHL